MRTITTEHLGQGATARDVAEYVAAVKRITPAFDGDEDAAEDWLWGDGAYLERINSCPGPECESCAMGDVHGVPATTRSINPEFSGYRLCAQCAAEYDSRI